MFYLFAQIWTESTTCEWHIVNLSSQRLDHPTRKLFSTSSDLGSPSSLYDHFRRAMVESWCFLGTPSTPISLSPLLNSTQDKWRGEPFKESLERVKYFAPPPPMTHFKVRFAAAAAVPDIGSAASHRELTPSASISFCRKCGIYFLATRAT